MFPLPPTSQAPIPSTIPDPETPHDLLALSREIKGIAETGLRYGDNTFDRERYQRLHQIASELLAAHLPDFRWPVELGYKLVFACRLIDGAPVLSHEIEAIDWFAPDALPELCPDRASPEYIALAFKHHAGPALPTEFD